jgi:hypothetical protein
MPDRMPDWMAAVPVLVNVRHRSALAVIRASPKNKNLVVKRVVLLHEGLESKKLMFYMIFSPEKIDVLHDFFSRKN